MAFPKSGSAPKALGTNFLWQTTIRMQAGQKTGCAKRQKGPPRFLPNFRSPHPEQGPHQPPQIVRHGADDVALVGLLNPPDPGAPCPAGLTDMGERALHPFTAQASQVLAVTAPLSSAVCIDRLALVLRLVRSGPFPSRRLALNYSLLGQWFERAIFHENGREVKNPVTWDMLNQSASVWGARCSQP